MKVTLSERNQAIVRARLRTGPFKTADDVVNDIIENYMMEVGYSLEEVEEALLISLKGPFIPYRKGAFKKMVLKDIKEAKQKK